MPVFSVVIPAYNARAHVADAIQSVLDQTLRDIEVIVVDDGSKDDTAELVRTRFPQVQLISKPNGGVSSARNVGCRAAQGEFIAFLDADDVWHREKCAAQLALFRAYPEVKLVRAAVVEDELRDPQPLCPADGSLPEHTCYQRLEEGMRDPFFSTSSVVVRREAYFAVGGFDEGLRIAEDIDFFLKVMALAPCVPKVGRPGVFKRPLRGSLGDDSEAGYVRLLEVYDRFLEAHPVQRQGMGEAAVRRIMAMLEARLAASQYRNGRGWVAGRTAWRSWCRAPNSLAFRVWGLLIFKPVKPAQARQAS